MFLPVLWRNQCLSASECTAPPSRRCRRCLSIALCFSSPLYAHFSFCFSFLGGLTYRHFGAETHYVELESVEESTRRQDWFASRRKPRQCQNKLDIRAVKFLSPVFYFFLSAFFFPLVEYFFSPPTFFDARVGGVGAFHFESVLAAAFFFCGRVYAHILCFFSPRCRVLFLFFIFFGIHSLCLFDGVWWSIKAAKAFSRCFFFSFSFVNIRVPAHSLAKNAKTKKSNHQSYHRRSSARLSTSALYQFSILFLFFTMTSITSVFFFFFSLQSCFFMFLCNRSSS